jgi:hypothetical protein
MRRWIQQIGLRLKRLAKHRQFDREIDEELAFHLAMREEKNRESGMAGRKHGLRRSASLATARC